MLIYVSKKPREKGVCLCKCMLVSDTPDLPEMTVDLDLIWINEALTVYIRRSICSDSQLRYLFKGFIAYLWPRMSDWSQTPPREMRWNSLPRVRATERPTLVLPTPGGPTKHRMGPLRLLFSCRTARYSRTRLFNFSMA